MNLDWSTAVVPSLFVALLGWLVASVIRLQQDLIRHEASKGHAPLVEVVSNLDKLFTEAINKLDKVVSLIEKQSDRNSNNIVSIARSSQRQINEINTRIDQIENNQLQIIRIIKIICKATNIEDPSGLEITRIPRDYKRVLDSKSTLQNIADSDKEIGIEE